MAKYIYIYTATKKGYEECEVGEDSINLTRPTSKTRRGRVGKKVAQTLDTGCGQGVAIPVLTPDRVNKRQNGRRFKEDGDPSFTLTAMDVHGVATEDDKVDTIYYPKGDCQIAIRRLTPKECFRLQGFPDEYFEKAEFMNSDSQLYKQAGNAVSVPVVYAIARKIE